MRVNLVAAYLFGSLFLNALSIHAQSPNIANNTKPIVYPTDFSVNNSTENLTYQILANDADGDKLRYELVSPKNSSSYTDLTIDSDSGVVSLTLNLQSLSNFFIEYVATDGKVYSDKAKLNIKKKLAKPIRGMGLKKIEPILYNSFRASSSINSKFKASLPSRVDLSPYFPIPGNQEQQGSCTAWAVGYAAKSYEEKIEMGWAYQTNTLFSPAWIYNQINGGVDQGSYIHDALALLVNKGAATLARMPYNASNYWTQPSASAISEAAKYKAASWVRLTNQSDIKDKLAKGLPVIIGIDIYPSFLRLSGANSVYVPSISEVSQGGHAVTIVGYDDNQYGGAYKVINSWGTNWGSAGYFWLPYSVAQTNYGNGYPLMNQAYTLYDAKNTDNPVISNLPNLSIASWSATYNATGAGSLAWKVANTGQAVTPQGWNLKLVFTKDKNIDAMDTIAATEAINCCTINPGWSLSRSSVQGNLLGFTLPRALASGYYYVALQVDNPSRVTESNEADNISFSASQVYISNSTLPNLKTVKWQASFINSSGTYANIGKGVINYQIINDSTAAITRPFWIGLFLVNSSNRAYLVYANSFSSIPSSSTITRSISSSVLPSQYDFNLNAGKDVFGSSIPNGAYKLRFVVDYPAWIAESNEGDNTSDNLSFYNLPLKSSTAKTLNINDSDAFIEQALGGVGQFDEIDADIILRGAPESSEKKKVVLKTSAIKSLPVSKEIIGDNLVITPLKQDISMPKISN